MCIKLDKYKASLQTAAGFIYSGQQTIKDKWDASCWIIVISFGSQKMAAAELIISHETHGCKVGNEGSEPIYCLPICFSFLFVRFIAFYFPRDLFFVGTMLEEQLQVIKWKTKSVFCLRVEFEFYLTTEVFSNDCTEWVQIAAVSGPKNLFKNIFNALKRIPSSLWLTVHC